MVVPWPGADSTVRLPPTISTRSRMPSSPRRLFLLGVQHPFHLEGFAVVCDFQANGAVGSFRMLTSTRLACACRATLVSASWATR